jgi:hypothetical protein
MSARKIFRRFVRLPVEYHAAAHLHEPELWQWNNPPDSYESLDQFQPPAQEELFPHL